MTIEVKMEGAASMVAIPLEGQRLPFNFERPLFGFYAVHLVWKVGARLEASELRTAYLAWAADNYQPSLSFRDLRRDMVALGHRHFRSNRMHFADVEILREPRGPEAAHEQFTNLLAKARSGLTIAGIDRLVSQVTAVRQQLLTIRTQLELPL